LRIPRIFSIRNFAGFLFTREKVDVVDVGVRPSQALDDWWRDLAAQIVEILRSEKSQF
jgi:hypothetical protein